MIIFRSHWSLEESNGFRTDDMDGNHLNIFNENGRRPGKIQYATYFKKYDKWNNGNLHTRLEIEEGLELDTDTFSAFAWFNSDVPFTDNFILARRSDTENSWAIRIANNQLRFETSADNRVVDVQYIAKPTIQTDHLIGVSYNSSNKVKRMFFDGDLYETTAFHSNHLNGNPHTFTLASMSGGGRNFEGWLDQVGFIPFEITLQDWLFIWNDGNGRSWDEYGLFSSRLHQKLQLVTLTVEYPDVYKAIIPGEAEFVGVEGTSKLQPFNEAEVIEPSEYTSLVPDSYRAIKPGEGE